MRHELHLCSFWVKHNTQHCENEPYGLSQSYWKLEQCSDFDWDLVFYLAFKKITLFNLIADKSWNRSRSLNKL